MAAELGIVRATPWLTDPGPAADGAEPAVLQPLPRPEGAAEPAVRPDLGVPRRVYIRKEDLERHGYTASCRRCRLMREGGRGAGIAHHEGCRERLERATRASGDVRVAEVGERAGAVWSPRRLRQERQPRHQHQQH